MSIRKQLFATLTIAYLVSPVALPAQQNKAPATPSPSGKVSLQDLHRSTQTAMPAPAASPIKSPSGKVSMQDLHRSAPTSVPAAASKAPGDGKADVAKHPK